ncbi:integrase [Pseudoxanthomonas winnipegensis]|uniref:Integrase n=1 Tax=Pseudoxanthomonas winnipegensis TaxID=2480810 RepID=A0A4Q8M508_9GAMM|nr:integrase [Pseudoxanthomonas winnipegensis]TAA41584.1 integrase [Pseudoxanthomonas winnipegensis]
MGITLTTSLVRQLDPQHTIGTNDRGNASIVPNPDGKAYRLTDRSPDAPTGFGLYVGMTKTTYEVSKRVAGKLVRVSLGNVKDMSLAEAYEQARAQITHIKSTGESTKREVSTQVQQMQLRALTVSECMNAYIDNLNLHSKNKGTMARSAKNSLARLSREDVNLQNHQIIKLSEVRLLEAWDDVRTSAMLKSNRIKKDIAVKLAKRKNWWNLKLEEYEELGLQGKYVQRAKAAGIEATEQTFNDLSRAIEFVLKRERKNAQREGRQAVLIYNPITDLREKEKWRTSSEKAEHYRKAQTRNPLANEDNSLPMVMKALIYRRNMQNGLNAVGVDYLLLTLLWGTRRNEAMRLHWYSDLTNNELINETHSWVWLADDPTQVNPTTKKRGSQVFLHDTKNGGVRFLPVTYFAERIIKMRWQDRLAAQEQLPRDLIKAQKELADTKAKTKDYRKIGKAENDVRKFESKIQNLRWVFPARSGRAEKGHYTDCKSIVKNVREDSGLLDLRHDIDIGLSPHDLRRTLGRFAEEKFMGARVVSDMLNHKVRGQGAAVTDLYNAQEWATLSDAFAAVEEAMVATSPRVWNFLKGTDKQRLDESNDPMVEIRSNLRKGDA